MASIGRSSTDTWRRRKWTNECHDSSGRNRVLEYIPPGSLIVAATWDLAWTHCKRHPYHPTTPLRVAC
jgi:hypothetical protein